MDLNNLTGLNTMIEWLEPYFDMDNQQHYTSLNDYVKGVEAPKPVPPVPVAPEVIDTPEVIDKSTSDKSSSWNSISSLWNSIISVFRPIETGQKPSETGQKPSHSQAADVNVLDSTPENIETDIIGFKGHR